MSEKEEIPEPTMIVEGKDVLFKYWNKPLTEEQIKKMIHEHYKSELWYIVEEIRTVPAELLSKLWLSCFGKYPTLTAKIVKTMVDSSWLGSINTDDLRDRKMVLRIVGELDNILGLAKKITDEFLCTRHHGDIVAFMGKTSDLRNRIASMLLDGVDDKPKP